MDGEERKDNALVVYKDQSCRKSTVVGGNVSVCRGDPERH